MTRLTKKQETFCNEFMVDLNATQAAIRSGYSQKTARQIATENLSKPAIQHRLFELQQERITRCRVTADEVVEKLRAIADQWKINPSAACRALELLGRHLGLFEKDHRQAAESRSTEISVVLSAAVVTKPPQQSGMEPIVC